MVRMAVESNGADSSTKTTSSTNGREEVLQRSNDNDWSSSSATTASCSGGLCVGMKDGPHEGGPSSYPISWNKSLLRGTAVRSTMTVPDLPSATDGITYYIWTDIFFGDGGSLGRMNQLVPQLLLGKALDGSTGSPRYAPEWGPRHDRWMFGAHYFFEIYNVTTDNTDAHAAYGNLHPANPGGSPVDGIPIAGRR